MTDAPGEQSSDIAFTYSLQDQSLDELKIIFRYRISNQEQWVFFDTVSSIQPSEYSNVHIWMSQIDADGIDDTLTIEAIPTDGWGIW